MAVSLLVSTPLSKVLAIDIIFPLCLCLMLIKGWEMVVDLVLFERDGF